MRAQRLRPAQHLFEVAAGQGQCGHPGHRPHGVLPLRVRGQQRRRAEGVTVGQHPQHGLVAVLAGADPVRACRGRSAVRGPPAAPLGEHVAGGELPLDEPVRQRLQRRGVLVAAQRRQLPQLQPESPGLRQPVETNSTRPSPRVWVSRRLTRYVPPETCVQGRTRSSQRDEIPCICGTVLVVVASLRAAAVSRLERFCSISDACGPDVGSTDVVMKKSHLFLSVLC